MERGLSLQFTTTFENHGITLDSCTGWGSMRLTIRDMETGDTLGYADTLLKSMVGRDNQNFVSQITIKLPDKLIQKQLEKNNPNGHLLTQVKFQCN